MSKNVLSAFNLKKSIGPRILFEGITFGLSAGLRLGLVGPNGSGKSTLLKCMAGLDKVDSGDLVWSSQVSKSYVAQNPNASHEQTIEDFIFDPIFEKKTNRFDLEMRFWELASKLDFKIDDLQQSFLSLSGGGQKKAQIIKGLLPSPDFLLMDEPTNHLDVESIMWVEEYLRQQQNMSYIVVSHDRLFLQNTVDEIIEINPTFKDGYIRCQGGYAEYVEQRAQYVTTQQLHQKKKENTLRREMEWLRRGAIARLKKQQARQNSTHELIAEVSELKDLNRSRKIDMEMKSSGRSPKKLVEIENLSVSRGDQPLFKNFTSLLHKNTRMGLLGSNGSGKTSLIRAIMDEIKPGGIIKMEGTIKRYEELKINYFEQHRQSLDPNKTVLRFLSPEGDYVHVRGEAVHNRSYLDRYGFRRDQHDLKIKEISGGEQNRLLLAQLMTQECQLLILDEPTNDLDFDTLNSLRETIDEFDGAIILVSHDRAFLDEVCNDILYFSGEAHDFELIKFTGFLQWQEWFAEQNKKSSSKKSKKSSGDEKSDNQNKTSRLGFNEQKEFDEMEQKILLKENLLTDLRLEIGKDEVMSNSKQLIELTKNIDQLETEVEKMYLRWQELEKRKGLK